MTLITMLFVESEKHNLSELAKYFNKMSLKEAIKGEVGFLPFDVNKERLLKEIGDRVVDMDKYRFTVLTSDGQKIYDKFEESKYAGRFFVLAPENEKQSWGERKVVFVEPQIKEEELYKIIKESITQEDIDYMHRDEHIMHMGGGE